MGLNQFKTLCGGIQFPKGNPHLSLGLEPGFELPALPLRVLAQLGWACGSRFQDILPASCPFPGLGKALCPAAHHPGSGILLASLLPPGWGALGMLQPSPGDVPSLRKGAGMENPQIPHVLGVLPAPPAPAAGCRWLWIHRCSAWMSQVPAGGNLPTPHPAAPGCMPIPHPPGVPRDVPVRWNALGCPCPLECPGMSLSPSQCGTGGSLAGTEEALGVEWGGNTVPKPWGMLGAARDGSLGTDVFLPSHLKAAVCFNFQNVDVRSWKTGKAKQAESGPACV